MKREGGTGPRCGWFPADQGFRAADPFGVGVDQRLVLHPQLTAGDRLAQILLDLEALAGLHRQIEAGDLGTPVADRGHSESGQRLRDQRLRRSPAWIESRLARDDFRQNLALAFDHAVAQRINDGVDFRLGFRRLGIGADPDRQV